MQSRTKAGIYVPTHMDTPERWPRPKRISRFFRPPRGRLFMFPMLWSGNPCSPITETLYPSSQVTQGPWDANVHTVLDSASDGEFATNSDNSATTCATLTDVGVCEVHHTNPTGTPASSDCQGIRIVSRFRLGGADCGTGCGEGTQRLYQGAVAKTGEKTQGSLGCSFSVNLSSNLTTGEIDAITDHDDLRTRIDGAIGHFDEKTGDVELECSFSRIEYYEA